MLSLLFDISVASGTFPCFVETMIFRVLQQVALIEEKFSARKHMGKKVIEKSRG